MSDPQLRKNKPSFFQLGLEQESARTVTTTSAYPSVSRFSAQYSTGNSVGPLSHIPKTDKQILIETTKSMNKTVSSNQQTFSVVNMNNRTQGALSTSVVKNPARNPNVDGQKLAFTIGTSVPAAGPNPVLRQTISGCCM